MSGFLLDSNTLIDFLRGNGKVQENMLRHAPGEVKLCTLTAYEIWRGAEQQGWGAAKRRTLDEMLAAFPMLDFDLAAAREAARIKAALAVAGNDIGPVDTLIAATARAHRATLVTHNLREFRRVAGLKLEDWFD